MRIRSYDVPVAWVRRVAVREALSLARRQRRRLAALARLDAPSQVPELSWDAVDIHRAMVKLPLRQQLGATALDLELVDADGTEPVPHRGES